MKKTYFLGIFTMLLSHAFAFDYNTSNPSYDEFNTIYFTETGVNGSNIKSIEIDDVDKYKMTVVFVDDTEYLIQLSSDKEFDLQGRFDKTTQLYISKRTGTNCDKKEWSNYKITFSEVEENHIIKHPYHFYNTQCNSGSRSIGTLESSDVISKSGNPKWLNNSYHLYFYSNNNTTATPKPFNISLIELERLGEVYVDIPDANFKQILLNNAQINLNGDSEISIDEAESYTGQIIAEDTNISTLNGIGAFKNITELWCRDMGLTDIDISENTALTFLVCFGNNFTSLDLTKNIALNVLNCSNNQITSLDLSQNKAVTEINCDSNSLTSLDLSENPLITHLSCKNNQINSLDLSFNQKIQYLYCRNNQIVNLDVSQNLEMVYLSCNNNLISSIDVSKSTGLLDFYCHNNILTSLDVSNNLVLNNLYCYNNQIECVKVNDENNVNSGFVKDNTTIWSEDCSALYNQDIVNNTFEVYPNPANNFITIDSTLKGNYNLVSMLGKTVLRGSVNEGENTLDISTLDKGIYFLNVTSNKGSETIKIIKE